MRASIPLGRSHATRALSRDDFLYPAQEPLRTGKYPINPYTHRVEVVPTANVVLNWATGKTEAEDERAAGDRHRLEERRVDVHRHRRPRCGA